MISFSPSSTPRQIWLIVSVIAGGIGWLTGAPIALILGCVAVLWLPVLAAYLPNHWARESESFQVLGWTLIGVIGLALSGGIRSPLTILFALGPLTGLALSKRKIAVEAAIFSAISFFSFWVLNLWIKPPLVPDQLVGFTTALALAAIIYAGVLSATAIVNLRRRVEGEFSAQAKVKELGPSMDLRGGVHLPSDFASAVVSITPQGRIRAIEGNRSLVAPMRVGEIAVEALGRYNPALDESLLARDSTTVLQGVEGQSVTAQIVQLVSGPVVILTPKVDGESSSDALRERTQFFASLGHDLKTPLNAIIGFADMMRSGLRGPLPEAYQDYSEIIQESGQDMLLLVDDILDLAKAESNKLKLELEPVDLAASGASVLRQMQAQAERAGVTLEFDLDQEVWAEADARAVRQIWQNLLSNAIKYSVSGEDIILQVGERSDAVFLSVEDFGAGMDAEDLERIGSPFRQGTNASGRLGTGLGLAVVKQFADLHGGFVKVETAKGQGTRVEVTFRPADMSNLNDFEKAAQ
ncbi:MAG: HAMP domain-containing sensor histidine kinase [Pseudomonadota bacterium]